MGRGRKWPFTELLREYTTQRDAWDLVGNWMVTRLTRLTKELFTPALISCRSKEPYSLVLKAHSRDRTDADSFHDKIAARVALFYLTDVNMVVDAIQATFNCPAGVDDKGATLGALRLGYRGIHCDVLLEAGLVAGTEPLAGREIWCEVQIHTVASALWAATGHPLSYKTAVEPEEPTRRAVNTLSALTEVYDHELVRVKGDIEDQLDYPAGRVLLALERVYYSLFGNRDHDGDTSRQVVQALMPAFTADELARIDSIMRDFAEQQHRQLDFIYRDNDPAEHQIPLLMQPEALLVFERLEVNKPKLDAAWAKSGYPGKWYEDLAAVWGTPT